MALTNKQRAFIEYYLGKANWNASAAARLAGYSEKAAQQAGSEVLLNPVVKAEINARLAKLAMGPEECLQRLGEQARSELSQYVTINEGGGASLDMQAVRDAGKLHLVKKVSWDSAGRQVVESYDAQAALALIARRHKLLTDQADISVTSPSIDRAVEAIGRRLAGLAAGADAAEVPQEPEP